MTLVLDSSVTLAWIHADEFSTGTFEVSKIVSDFGAWVPAIWRLEVGNNLHLGVRRGRLTAAACDEALAALTDLDILIDEETNAFAWTASLRLAQQFGLTLYDACYLELAQRRDLPLASLDRDLRKAAAALDIDLLGV
jgi:predicted nucleic acid-binding protein